ncbi:MAG: hypothetical protein ABJN34_07780 [Litoreibacter sp.]|uniref:hypothetical protein n=1 Tax=Litoreibacter sp. TaxID=1969459 RepID=UPI00329A6BC5
MANLLEVSKHETGVLRVFQVTDDVALPYSMKGDCENLERAMGGTSLNPQEMQHISAGELSDADLETLLVDGYDIAPASINLSEIPHKLSSILLVRSAAFENKPATLHLTDNANLVAAFTEGKAPAPQFTPLESDAAKGVLDGPVPEVKKGRSFGDRMALTALAALVCAVAVLYTYYIGF